MSFQPVVPLSGYTGWRFLQRTMDAQRSAFTESRPITSATDYFKENIGKVSSAEDLVADRKLLRVALGAFGLDADIGNKFFVQTILEQGSVDRDALANRLSDTRYAQFSRAFGFGDTLGALNGFDSLMSDIVRRFENRQFEVAVGEQDNDMRLALSISDSLAEVLKSNKSKNAQWFAMMGNPPMRRVFETALGLPASLAKIDIDQQLQTFKDRAESQFGTSRLSDFTEPDQQDALIRMFLVRSESQAAANQTGQSIALTLLQGMS